MDAWEQRGEWAAVQVRKKKQGFAELRSLVGGFGRGGVSFMWPPKKTSGRKVKAALGVSRRGWKACRSIALRRASEKKGEDIGVGQTDGDST